MSEVSPGDPLSAKPLLSVYPGGYNGAGKTLTLRTAFRSLVTYTRTTLIATRRPPYVPCDMSANPPHSTSVEPSEQSGMCMEVGITQFRLQNLQSSLNNFIRSRSDIALFSRRCGSCQPWRERGRRKARLIHFVNTSLGFWLRILQKLEEGGDPRKYFPKLL